MKKNEIKLSVIVFSYKQVKYIREAIDSILMQKVDFKYELLLADDCSQDGTYEIMKDYEKKYPNIIRVLERKKNLGASKNSMDARSQARGEYMTSLEGDDYWIDENKLQTQVDFLDNNPDYSAISHLQEARNLDNKVLGYFPKGINKDKTVYNVTDFINKGKVFSTSATMYRNFFKDKKMLKEFSELRKFDPLIGDAQMNVYLCRLGKIYIMKKAMMVYRMRHNDGNSNFNSSHRINEIEYRYMNIYLQLEKFYNNEYSFYKKVKKNYTLGVAYDICKLNFKDIKRFNELCPLKYKVKIWICFPFTCAAILFRRFIKR